MCQVQIIRKFNSNKYGTLTKSDVKNFFSLLASGSYSNRDAYGLFSKEYMFRKAEAFYDEKAEVVGGITKNLLASKPTFVVGHNRLATQGDKRKNFNNHPFPSKDWVIVHNGVLYNDDALIRMFELNYKEDTDSAVVVQLLQKFYDAKVHPVTCIKRVAEQLEGSFSICAYNKTEDKLYYFKNDKTSFGFRLFKMKDGSEILVGSTDVDNFDELYVDEYMIFHEPLYDSFYQCDAQAGMIYEINDKGISEICTFAPKKERTHYGSKASSGSSTSFHETKTKKKTWNVVGGIYENDWDEEEEEWANGRDIDYSTQIQQIVPQISHADWKENLEEDAQDLLEEIESVTSEFVDYQMAHERALVIYTFQQTEIPMHKIVEQLRDKNIHAEVYGENAISITYEELQDLY